MKSKLPDEIESHKATVKNMDNGETKEISLDDFTEEFMRIILDAALADIGQTDNLNFGDFTLLNGGKI